MSAALTAGPSLEPAHHRVGRFTEILTDPRRDGRTIPVDVWYPAAPDCVGELSFYELLPGIGFTAAALQGVALLEGTHPLVLWSHGRTATRSSYALLCEALAARGFMVVAPEHAGDALGDWLVGAAVDDATNEANRIADAHFVLDTALHGGGPLASVAARVDPDRVAAAGHSYGGFTALSGGSGPTRHPRVRAVAGHQAFTRSMPKQVFADISVPVMLVVSALDATTPPATDADRAWAKLGSADAWRVDVERAGHQGCSDVGLYVELAPHVEGLPDLVRAFIASMGADVTGTVGDPWRETVTQQVAVLGAFLTGALGVDVDGAAAEFAAVGEAPGVTVSTRGGFPRVAEQRVGRVRSGGSAPRGRRSR